MANSENSNTHVVMSEIVTRLKLLFGKNLRQVILFGSYARGEQEEYSDMDIMALVNLSDEELKNYHYAIVDIISDISLRYGVLPSIICKNFDHFYQWVPYLPFYRNVKIEGVELYAS